MGLHFAEINGVRYGKREKMILSQLAKWKGVNRTDELYTTDTHGKEGTDLIPEIMAMRNGL